MVNKAGYWVTTSTGEGYAYAKLNTKPDIVRSQGVPYAVGLLAKDSFKTVQEQAASRKSTKIKEHSCSPYPLKMHDIIEEKSLAILRFESYLGGCAFSDKYAFVRQWEEGKHSIQCFELKTGAKAHQIFTTDSSQYDPIKCSGGILFCIANDHVDVINPELGKVTTTFSANYAIQGAEVFEDKLVATTFQNEYYIWSLTSGEEIAHDQIGEGIRHSVYYPFDIKENKIRFIHRRDSSLSLLTKEFKVKGSDLEEVYGTEGSTWLSKIGGYLIASAENGCKVRKFADEYQWRELSGKFQNYNSYVSCCLDGKLFLTGNIDSIKMWNIDSGELLSEYKFNLEKIYDLFIWNKKIVAVTALDDTMHSRVTFLNVIPREYQELMNGICYKPTWND